VRDLSEIARVCARRQPQYRLLKAVTPGPFTFILEATTKCRAGCRHPSRKTIGIRVPENAILLALLEELGEPLIGTTLQLPGDDHMLSDPEEVQRTAGQADRTGDRRRRRQLEPTTIVDLTGPEAVLVRAGRGDAAFG
jgi:tRNA threonylcarbamoyl adenosine modification protein (Sua5/YciO/YrdC/YwlC family)